VIVNGNGQVFTGRVYQHHALNFVRIGPSKDACMECADSMRGEHVWRCNVWLFHARIALAISGGRTGMRE
jgi:hypothetical protein